MSPLSPCPRTLLRCTLEESSVLWCGNWIRAAYKCCLDSDKLCSSALNAGFVLLLCSLLAHRNELCLLHADSSAAAAVDDQPRRGNISSITNSYTCHNLYPPGQDWDRRVERESTRGWMDIMAMTTNDQWCLCLRGCGGGNLQTADITTRLRTGTGTGTKGSVQVRGTNKYFYIGINK